MLKLVSSQIVKKDSKYVVQKYIGKSRSSSSTMSTCLSQQAGGEYNGNAFGCVCPSVRVTENYYEHGSPSPSYRSTSFKEQGVFCPK